MAAFNVNPYAQLTNQLVTPTPVHFDNALYFNFIIKGNMAKMRKMCDQWFNVPTEFNKVYEPVMPYVMLSFAYYPRAFAAEWKSPDNNFGFVPYKELIVVMFVKEKRTFGVLEDLGIQSPNFYGFVPYLFLDHPAPVATGREVYGMPKVIGDLEYPQIGDKGSNQKFSVSALGFDKSKVQTPIAKKQNIIEITCPDDFDMGEIMKQANGNPQDAIARNFYRDTRTSSIDLDLASQMIKVHEMSYVSMRQHRNILAPETAIEKSIIEFPGENITVTNGGMLPGPFEINYGENSKTYPMFDSLGLEKKAFMSFWFQWSFILNNGINTWEWKGK